MQQCLLDCEASLLGWLGAVISGAGFTQPSALPLRLSPPPLLWFHSTLLSDTSKTRPSQLRSISLADCQLFAICCSGSSGLQKMIVCVLAGQEETCLCLLKVCLHKHSFGGCRLQNSYVHYQRQYICCRALRQSVITFFN